MAGNSQRRGATRKPASKKGATAGSGGRGRRALEGRGPTPKATERPHHPAGKRRAAAEQEAAKGATAAKGAASGDSPAKGGEGASRGAGQPPRRGASQGGGQRPSRSVPGERRGSASGERRTGRTGPSGRARSGAQEVVGGRNSVVEALRAGVPASSVHVATAIDVDDRVREILRLTHSRQLPLLEVTRSELDRMTDGSVHQGVVIQVPPYDYAHPEDLLAIAQRAGQAPLVVALDGVTDPRNLGAVLRSAGAFGAHGVVVPERRAAGVTAAAWKVSAGAAARVRVARATNLVRALQAYREAGCFIVGLDAAGTVEVGELQVATDPLVIVVGSEGKGLSRLVRENCDVVAGIPIAATTESLNAGVAAGIALYEVARLRSRG